MAARCPVVAITGTTGTGKSQLAVELAREYNGEVINADALQLYKGLPIATNKISPEEMQGVEHHLLDHVNIEDEPWTIGQYLIKAQRVIAEVHSRGKLPIVVGGTHYYIQSLVLEDTVSRAKPEGLSDQDRDSKWPILKSSADVMMAKLRELDPEAAQWWHPRDIRKIRNSLALCLESGRKVSDIYREQKLGSAQQGQSQNERYRTLYFHLHTDRSALIERLDSRVEVMLNRGLLEEVRFMHEEHARLSKLSQAIDESMGIWVAIGYKEFSTYLDALKHDPKDQDLPNLLSESCERTKISTRQYATRQDRWVRNRLLPALQTAGAGNRFYVLDTTIREQWIEAVSVPAKEVTTKFLGHGSLPSASSIGKALDILSSDNKAVRTVNTCEACQVTTSTASQWEQHLASRKHKMTTRGSGKRTVKRVKDPANAVESAPSPASVEHNQDVVG